MATRVPPATDAAPFKGEAFPAYVVSRTRRVQPRLISAPSAAMVIATNGPSAEILTTQGITLAMASAVNNTTVTTSTVIVSPSRSSVVTSKTPTRLQRPSLSEQLKAISQGAHDITSQLRSSYQLDSTAARSLHQQKGCLSSSAVPVGDSLLEATTIHLVVGRLECRFPCPVQFAADRCAYLFQHPFAAKEIHMLMYYHDMRQLQWRLPENSLRFRIARPLEQFGDDYQPSNPNHALKLVFATASEALKVRQFLASRKSSFGDRESGQ